MLTLRKPVISSIISIHRNTIFEKIMFIFKSSTNNQQKFETLITAISHMTETDHEVDHLKLVLEVI